METTQEQIQKAKQTLSDAGYLVSGLWHRNDINDKAMEMGVILTQDQIDKIAHSIECYLDCEVGINWDVISSNIQDVLGASGPISGPIFGASGPISGPIFGASGPISGPIFGASGPISGTISGPISGTISGTISGPISGPISGTISGTISGPILKKMDIDQLIFGGLWMLFGYVFMNFQKNI